MDNTYGLYRPHHVEPDAYPVTEPWRSGPPPDTDTTAFTAPDLAVLDGRWSSEEELTRLLWSADSQASDPLATVPPTSLPHDRPYRGRPTAEHRAPLRRPLPWARIVGCLIAVAAAVLVAVVSVVSGMVAYSPLYRVAASRVPAGLVRWWPLLVYGPWLAGAFSVLRAALYGRRAVHGWIAVLFFSAVAVVLCVGSTTLSVVGSTVVGLPAVAALTCFFLLVRQLTLTRPLCRTTRRHRRGAPRH